MAPLTLWERVKLGSKTGIERSRKAFDRTSQPVNRQSTSNKLGATAFWPTNLEKECDKAATILRSFCLDGFHTERSTENDTSQPQNRRNRIPASVIRDAKALAIFTTMRNGLWVSTGAGGSGVLIAQKDDGSWSPPSSILVHTSALGFLPGIDIYDCVVVINTEEALEAFFNVRYTLGSMMDIEAGPLAAHSLDSQYHHGLAPLSTYVKSRGSYAAVQIDGTIIIERADENANFYGHHLSAEEIVNGMLQQPPSDIRRLLETIKAAQGDTVFDAALLPKDPPPSDYEVSDRQVFGLPDKMDPDPYGVLALQKEGMNIVEAGSKQRASWEEFSFCPSPTSPVHLIYQARSNTDRTVSFSRRDSWRGSTTSNASQRFIKANSMRKSNDSRLRISTTFHTSTQARGWEPSQNSIILDWRNGLDRQSSRTSTTPSSWPMRLPRDSVVEDDFFDKDASVAPTPSAYLTPPSTPPSERADSAISPEPLDGADDSQSASQGVQVLGSSVAPILAKATLVDIPKRTFARTPPQDADELLDHNIWTCTPSPELPSKTESDHHLIDPIVAALLESEGRIVHETALDTSSSNIHRQVSKSSNSSGTWQKIRALRAIDDDDE